MLPVPAPERADGTALPGGPAFRLDISPTEFTAVAAHTRTSPVARLRLSRAAVRPSQHRGQETATAVACPGTEGGTHPRAGSGCARTTSRGCGSWGLSPYEPEVPERGQLPLGGLVCPRVVCH